MNYLSRKDLAVKFEKIVEEYGRPKNGTIFSYEQLISEVVKTLSCFKECAVIYEYGIFYVDASIYVVSHYASDYFCLGLVKQSDWFNNDQILALHELAFGYQF